MDIVGGGGVGSRGIVAFFLYLAQLQFNAQYFTGNVAATAKA